MRGTNSSRLFQHTFWAEFSWVRCKWTSMIWKCNYVLLPSPIHPLRYSQSLNSYWEHSKQVHRSFQWWSSGDFLWYSDSVWNIRRCDWKYYSCGRIPPACMATTELMPAHNNRYWFAMSLSICCDQQLTATLLAIIVFTLHHLVLDRLQVWTKLKSSADGNPQLIHSQFYATLFFPNPPLSWGLIRLSV